MTTIRVVHDADRPEIISKSYKKLCDIVTGSSHGFDPGIANYFKDVDPAIVFSHIHFWLRQNKVLGVNQIEGSTWVYLTVSQISNYFGYLSEKKVRNALDKLVDHGFLKKGFHSANKFDRKVWYALNNEEDETKLSNNVYHLPSGANAVDLEGKSDLPPRANVYKVIDKKTDKKKQQPEKIPVPKKEPPSSVVVVPSLEKLKLTQSVKKKISKTYSVPEIDIAVEKTLRFKGRLSDAATLIDSLKDPDKYEMNKTKESIKQINLEFLERNKHLDMKKIGDHSISIDKTGVLFYQKGYSIPTQFFIEDEEFVEKFTEMFEKIREKNVRH